MVRLLRLALATILAASALPAQQPFQPPGPRTGALFPAFRLPDQTGNLRDLKSIEGPHGVLLIFFQSADWCPYCKNQLAEMEASLTSARQAGIGLAAVSYDSPAVLREFAARRSITFPLLSDHASTLIRAASLEMAGPPKGSPFFGAAYPAAVLVNERGIVRAKYIHGDLRERDSAAAVLMQRFGIGGSAAATVSGKRIQAQLTASGSEVSPGERILLEVSFDLRPGLHVYAPGVHDYIPIDWSLRPPVGWNAAPVVFPPSETLRLEAIQETVPAYRGHVVLRRDVTVSPDASPGPVILSGALRYQACDDTMCYIPETLPLEWKFTVLPLDKTRAAK